MRRRAAAALALALGATLACRPAATTVPDRWSRLVVRVDPRAETLVANLRYEGHNVRMRGGLARDGSVADSGAAIAGRWRALAAGTGGVFAFRDSLFSQQDHPFLHDAHALMLPPSWITAAAVAPAGWRPPAAPEPADDSAWAAFRSPSDLFGPLPASPALFAAATAPLEQGRERTANARRALGFLLARAAELAGGRTPARVAEIGAEIVARSDRDYFTPELRRRRVVLVFVDNPTAHERREGKGVAPPGISVPDAVLEHVREVLYRRRLADGDIAIERFDLSSEREVARAIRLTEMLLPRGAPAAGGRVWLWVHGGIRPRRPRAGSEGGIYTSADAATHVERFRARLRRADVDTSRLMLLCKPSFAPPAGPGRAAALERELERFARLDLPLGVDLTAAELLSIVATRPGR